MVFDTFGFSPFCPWKPAPISAYAARLADFVLSSTKHLFAIFKLLCLFTPICLYSSTVPIKFFPVYNAILLVGCVISLIEGHKFCFCITYNILLLLGVFLLYASLHLALSTTCR